ncbi:GNAT family N-acetyltransferase [Lysobacter pythonis]|uniref:GNAT family N-acetyltransferase n=1 Tax=Solilutibacter pythonis TaxID=2483112 RepID=A0A3M2HMT2_9GAMM|nr:GNAT family N-acetyltransferase [Lysobacter pythonis]RMH91021.1 GNAT family N-acetyltransferase [Lysobacter pythonis]
MNLAFRRATRADIPSLIQLVTSAYRGEASRAGWTTEADLLDGARIDTEHLAADIERARSLILIGEAEGRMLACAHVAVEDGAGYFGMFSVWPMLQGRGIGKRMLLEAERIARDEFGQTTMRMSVIDLRDALIDYYARRGYRRTGIHKPFPYGDERFGTPRRDDLRFEILEKNL